MHVRFQQMFEDGFKKGIERISEMENKCKNCKHINATNYCEICKKCVNLDEHNCTQFESKIDENKQFLVD